MTDAQFLTLGFKRAADDAGGIDPSQIPPQLAAQLAQGSAPAGPDAGAPAPAAPADPNAGAAAPQLTPEMIQELLAVLTQLAQSQGGAAGGGAGPAAPAPAGPPAPPVDSGSAATSPDPGSQKLGYEDPIYVNEFKKYSSELLNLNHTQTEAFFKTAAQRMFIEANLEKISTHYSEFEKVAKAHGITETDIPQIYRAKYLTA